MSNLMNKAKEMAKDVMRSDKSEDPRSSNSGPHSSNIANKLDPRVDSDRDNRDDPTSRVGGYGNTQDTYGSSTTGGQFGGTTGTGGQYDDPRSTNTGPHSSNLANKADPRIDSDRDGRNDPTSRAGGYGNTQDTYGSSTTGGQFGGTTGGSQFDNPRSDNVGPHSSNLANKVDPRVDSDRDGRNDPTSRAGGYGNTQGYSAAETGQLGGSTETYGTSGTTGGAYGSAGTGQLGGTNTYGTAGGNQFDDPRSTNTGPHSSNIANKLDPRVDSDRDGRNDPTSNVGGYGATQQQPGYGSGGAGFADSSVPGGAQHHGGHHGHGHGHGHQQQHHPQQGGLQSSMTPGSGNASNTAGPYDSNIMNKLDPRVDSDMDGSKTYGGDRTNY